MPIIPIELPSGMMRNGTPYGARGRWVDGNLVRWHDGALRPIGGWQQRLTPLGAPVMLPATGEQVYRDAMSYTTLAGNREALFFSNASVQRLDSGDSITDVTPTGYPQGLSDGTIKTGYGTGSYGIEAYGTRRTATGLLAEPVQRVVSDMWGENPLFAVVGDGPLYQYAPGDAVALPIAEAPTDVDALIVTDQRIVMVAKNSPELREITWSDREDNTDWTPTVSNYAGSFRLQGVGKIVGLYKVLNQILVLTETDAHAGRYIGAPFVYGFDRVGVNCAPVWHTAVAKEARLSVWLGKRNFWIYDGTLRALPCDVMDFLIEDVDFDEVSKIHVQTVSSYSEIWWFYQSNASVGEVDSYVVFDHSEGHWSTGRLPRTVGFDAGAHSTPVMVAADGTVYNHELLNVAVDGDAFCITGPLELENGSRNMAVRYVLPDTESPNEVVMDFYTRQMPTADVVHHGPYAYENPISTSGVLGREVQMKITGTATGWEVGTMRFDVQAVGGGFR